MCSAFRGRRSSKSVRRLGTPRSGAPVSKTSAGTTYGIPGQVGTCKTVRRVMRSKSWEAGRLGEFGDGAALCALLGGAFGSVCGPLRTDEVQVGNVQSFREIDLKRAAELRAIDVIRPQNHYQMIPPPPLIGAHCTLGGTRDGLSEQNMRLR
jgi:hypothetical protein